MGKGDDLMGTFIDDDNRELFKVWIDGPQNARLDEWFKENPNWYL